MVGEGRLPPAVVPAVGDVAVGGPGAPEIGRVERSVGVERLGEAQPDRVARLAASPHGQPAHHVFSHVEDVDPGTEFADCRRAADAAGPDVRIGLCEKPAGRSPDFAGLHPARVVESRAVPARHLEAGVVLFAVEFAVGADRAPGREPPRSVAGDRAPRAVGILDFGLKEQFREPEMADARVPHREVTPVAQYDAEGVVSFVQGIGDVEGVVAHRPVVVGRGGGELLAADALPVEESLVEPQSADVERGAAHLARDAELAAQVAGRQSCLARILFSGEEAVDADPAGFPLRAVEQRDAPACRLRPLRAPLVGAYLYLPETLLTAGERCARIVDTDGFVGGDPSRVPFVRPVPGEQSFGGGHQNPVARLVHAALVGVQLPAQARGVGVDSRGVFPHLAAHAADAHAVVLPQGERSEGREGDYQEGNRPSGCETVVHQGRYFRFMIQNYRTNMGLPLPFLTQNV